MAWTQDRVTACIAWLSVCMLCAAWGSLLDETWRPIWTSFGMFGLTAAVALSTVEKQKRASIDAERRRMMQSRCNDRMAELERHFQSRDAIRSAARRILDNFQTQTSGLNVMLAEEQDPRQRTRCLIPVELTARSKGANPRRLTTTAMIRDLSSTGIGLVHDGRLDHRQITVHGTLGNGEQFGLSVSLLWERRWEGHDGWYTSGGKILEAVSTTASQREPCLSGTSNDGVAS